MNRCRAAEESGGEFRRIALAWLPTRNFEIGVEVIYARVTQDVRSANLTNFRRSDNNVTGRLRVERNF
jgi:hypothetical protein